MIARIGVYNASQGDNSSSSAEGDTAMNGDAMDTDDEADTVYLHGSAAARLFRQTQEQLSGVCAGEGIPVCIEATKILGLVLTTTPFTHTYDYRSAILHGHATVLDPENSPADRAEVLWALELLTDGVLAKRWANTRTPPDDFELMSTLVLKVRIDSASAKVRNHGVDEERKDLRDRRIVERVWTGVIPYLDMFGEPQPAQFNMVRHLPSYIEEHVRKHNDDELLRSRLPYYLWDFLSHLIFSTMAWLFGTS